MAEYTENTARDSLGDGPKYRIGSVITGMALVDILASAGKPMKLKDIAAAAGMPAAKAHRYLASFAVCGMVAQSGRSGLYDLGPMALRIGVAALRRDDAVERACTNLDKLRDEIRATCFVCGWSDQGPIILRWQDSQRPITVIVRIGSTMPLLTSATGRVFLSYLPRAATNSVLRAELADGERHLSPNVAGGSTEQIVDGIVKETRAAGMSGGDGDFQEGIAALAVPLFDPLDNAVGTVTAIGWSGEFDADPNGPIASALRRYAVDAAGGLM